eukprot:3180880-Alexandrium_andersonii.AAC.1
MGRFCDFLHPQLERDPWVTALHQLTVLINGAGALEPEILRLVFEELSLLIVPTSVSATDGRRKIRWAQENGNRVNFQLLNAPMDNSTVYQAQQNALPIDDAAGSSASASQPAKKRRVAPKKKAGRSQPALRAG